MIEKNVVQMCHDYSVVKEKEIMEFTGKWTDLEIIMLMKQARLRDLQRAEEGSGVCYMKVEWSTICKKEGSQSEGKGMGVGKGEEV